MPLMAGELPGGRKQRGERLHSTIAISLHSPYISRSISESPTVAHQPPPSPRRRISPHPPDLTTKNACTTLDISDQPTRRMTAAQLYDNEGNATECNTFKKSPRSNRRAACPPPKLYDNDGNVPKCPRMSHFQEKFSDKRALALPHPAFSRSLGGAVQSTGVSPIAIWHHISIFFRPDRYSSGSF